VATVLPGSEPGLTIGALDHVELPQVSAWAAKEGWNPGLCDLDVAWALEPEAFLALRLHGEFIGVGTIFVHPPDYGFMGLFIVDPAHRGHGLGTKLWTYRRDLLMERVGHGGVIGMDGVFAMVPFYERGGFELAYRDLRMEGTAHGLVDPDVVDLHVGGPDVGRADASEAGTDDLACVDLARMVACDRSTFPVDRTGFLGLWLTRQGVHTVGIIEDSNIVAFATARPSQVGYKLGPVVADNPGLARRVVGTLLDRIDGHPVQWDMPEPNLAALSMASDHGLHESFGCARMYLGGVPDIDIDRLFGVTSFEFG